MKQMTIQEIKAVTFHEGLTKEGLFRCKRSERFNY